MGRNVSRQAQREDPASTKTPVFRLTLDFLGGGVRQVSTSSAVPDCSKTTILITEAVKMRLSLLRCSSFTGAQRRLWENNYSLSLLWFAKEKKATLEMWWFLCSLPRSSGY